MSERQTKTPVFLHVHVRKCGGSTFHGQILKRNFGKGFYRDASLIDDRYSANDVMRLITGNRWLQAYSSHKISLDLPSEVPGRSLVAIAFVRDPVERFLSNYRYVKMHEKQWDSNAVDLSIDDYISASISDGKIQQQRQHSQLEQLVGVRGNEALDKLRQVLETQEILLSPIERFDDVCILLEKRYPKSFQSCAYKERLNTSKQPLEPLAESIQSLRQEIGEAEQEVVAIAQSQIEQELAKVFPNSETLERARADFQKRCRRRRFKWFG